MERASPPFPRRRFLHLPLDDIPGMDALMGFLLACVRERRLCRVMGISGPVVAMSQDSPELVRHLEDFTIVVPDGRGIELLAPLLGVHCGPTLPLPDIASAAIALAHREGLRVFVLGATAEVNARALVNLAERFPGLQVAGRDGYFPDTANAEVAAQIRSSVADIILLAMPTPKKESFMLDWQDRSAVPVGIGCGGYIDTVAGVTRLPPAWVSRLALSWLVRVAQEPRKLWRRIFLGNVRFIGLVAAGTARRLFGRR